MSNKVTIEQVYEIGEKMGIPKECVTNTLEEIRSWSSDKKRTEFFTTDATDQLKMVLRKLNLEEKLNGKDIPCPYCQPQDGEESIDITSDWNSWSSINAKDKTIEYDGGNGDYFSIHFCPFCGRSL